MADSSNTGKYESDDRLFEAIAAFEKARDAGKNPDPKEWLERFPEVSDKLAAYFAAEKDVKFALAPALSTMIDDKPPEIPGYRIIEKIGPGGMGVVYKAHRISTNSIVALKIIRPDRLEGFSPEQRRKTIERFITEAQAAAQLEHDNLVKVYEVGEHAGRPF